MIPKGQLCLSVWNIAMTQSGNWAWIALKNPGALSHESRFYPTPRRSRGRYPARLGSFWDTIEARKYSATVNGAGVVINRPRVKATSVGGSGRTGRRVFVWDPKSEQMVSVLEN